jgi:uncharacterized protein YndB with AHSA1/START domain
LHKEVRVEHAVERELVVPETPEEVWRSLAEPEWLGEDASIELCPSGELRAGERTGFVEEADAPRRLVFWWSAPEEESTRVELDLEKVEGGTRIHVTESRPLAVLDLRGRDLAVELGVSPPGQSPPGMPEMSASGLGASPAPSAAGGTALAGVIH